MAQAL